jgi:hypothetical protein
VTTLWDKDSIALENPDSCRGFKGKGFYNNTPNLIGEIRQSVGYVVDTTNLPIVLDLSANVAFTFCIWIYIIYIMYIVYCFIPPWSCSQGNKEHCIFCIYYVLPIRYASISGFISKRCDNCIKKLWQTNSIPILCYGRSVNGNSNIEIWQVKCTFSNKAKRIKINGQGLATVNMVVVSAPSYFPYFINLIYRIEFNWNLS